MYQVIIADDEGIERMVLAKKLRKFFPDSLNIREAANGRQVLELFAQERAQILILDIEMPGTTGLEAAETIRKQDAACSIIFLTAFDEFNYAKKAISVHATDYLLKPCADQELTAAVEEGMRQSDLRDRLAGQAAALQNAGASTEAAAGAKAAADVMGKGIQNTAQNPAGRQQEEESRPSQAQNDSAAAASEASSRQNSVRSQQERIMVYIDKNYGRDIGVSDIADFMGYSEAYFCKLFKQYFGESFVSYLTSYRIREAVRRMVHTDDTIREIGQAVGYADPNYFTKVFKRVTGKSPSEYRMQLDT